MPPVPDLSPDEVVELVADAFLWQEMKPRPEYEEDKTVDPATFAAYVGRYDYMGAVMDVVLEAGNSTAQLTGQPRFPIFPLGGNKILLESGRCANEFLKDDDGHAVSARHTQGGQKFVANGSRMKRCAGRREDARSLRR